MTTVHTVYGKRLEKEVVHKVGDIISITKYAKVTNNLDDTVYVTDLHNGLNFKISGDDLQQECLSADKFGEVQKVSRTELAEKLVSSHGRPFTAEFEKANGKERKLRGRILSSENVFGRSTAEDFDKPEDDRIRLVDHRTLSSLIVDNIKFVLK